MTFLASRIGRPVLGIFSKILEPLRLGSFGFLNMTQFIGAMNDNIYKLLIVYCFIQVEGTQASTGILASVGAIYVIPFLLFSQTAGMMADRFPKRSIIVVTRMVELCVMGLSLLAFGLKSKLLAFVGLFLLSTHSTIFGPCKYGIVPEIVPQEEISKANGILTSCTYSAIIVGTFMASLLTDLTNRNFVISVIICCVFSMIGLLASLKIQKTPAAGSKKKVTPWFLLELYRNLKVIRQEPSLLTAVLGSSYFLFVGSFVQLNTIPFAINILHLTDVQGGYLFLLTALGIGAGSLLAGKFSGKAVELGLVPIGGVGMTICCFLLDYYGERIGFVIPLVLMIGLFGGLYLVPLDSFIQVRSPKTYRGQVVAATNFFGFIGVLLSSGMLYFLSAILGLPADKGFTVIGIVTIFMIIFITVSMSGYIVRFFSFLVSRILFRVTLTGKEEIPLNRPSFFLIPHSFWPWAMVLLSSQRRRMRLFSLAADKSPALLARLAKRLLPIIEVHNAEDLLPTGEQGDLITTSIERGTSIGIFCSREFFEKHEKLWHKEWKHKINDPQHYFFVLNRISNSHPRTKISRQSLHAEAIKI